MEDVSQKLKLRQRLLLLYLSEKLCCFFCFPSLFDHVHSCLAGSQDGRVARGPDAEQDDPGLRAVSHRPDACTSLHRIRFDFSDQVEAVHNLGMRRM